MKTLISRGRWLAHPVLSVLLALVWLLLRQSLAPGDVLVAVAIALIVPRLVHPLLGSASRVKAGRAMVVLTWRVLWDIVASNIAVAKLVLNPAARPRPAWVEVPLRTRHPQAVALLASIITMTPGTVSCVVDELRGHILVHALDCDDAQAMVDQILQRYEVPLKEIFG